MTAAQQQQLATATQTGGLSVSLEAGGALCGSGSGKEKATQILKSLDPFLSKGGKLAYFALESIFSRTWAGCKTQSQDVTAEELAQLAKVVASALTGTKLFLYDALPHFSVGNDFPCNDPFEKYGLELGSVLTKLKKEMDKVGVPLSGYWMDCPFEYSRDYPNATRCVGAIIECHQTHFLV
jgi:hypothetical protein